MRIGLQIPAFNFPGGTPAIAPTLAQIAQTADQAGFDSLWLMDHFFQFQPLGPADDPMLEAYTTLAYLAALTRRVRLGVLVSGVVYRYPAVLVKTVSTLDVLSGGRAYLGLGAAWYEREARGLGLPFPGWSQRLVTLKKIESGERLPSRQMALRLAECLGIPSADRPLFIQIARGERTLAGLPTPATSADFPSLPRRTGPPTNLPASMNLLIGREQDLIELEGRLRGGARLLTLSGPGGVGKTRLAIQAGWDLLPDFPDGVILVDLAQVSNPELLPVLISQAVGAKLKSKLDLLDHLKQALRSKRMLLVLDNFEHLLPAGPSVSSLLAAAPGLRVVVTSRSALQLSEEELFVVRPLALPEAGASETELARTAAVRLLVERTQTASPDFSPDGETMRILADICRRLDGLPLAIELAAARLRILGPQATLDRLERRLDLLTHGPRDLPDRQQTLRNTLDWSFQLLTAAERRLFTWLGVFVAGFTLQAFEAVHRDLATPDFKVIDGLAGLVDRSLVFPEAGVAAPRFRLLETMREYALERLAANQEIQIARRHHLAYYLQLSETAETQLLGPQSVDWCGRLEAEQGNFWAALDWALGGGFPDEPSAADVEAGVRLAAALWYFWYIRGYLSEGRYWLGKALEKSRLQSRPRARLLTGWGTLVWQQGDYVEASAAFDESLAIWHRLEEPVGLAEALHLSGHVCFDRQDYSAAHLRFSESLAFNRELGNRLAIATLVGDLGLVYYHRGNYSAAREAFEESRLIFIETGNLDGLADDLLRLGDMARLEADFERAESLYYQGLELFLQLNSSLGIASAHHKLGYISLKRSDPGAAEQRFRESLSLQQEAGNKQGIAECLGGLASVAAARGENQQAVELFRQGQALLDQIGAPLAPADRLEWERDQKKLGIR